MIDSVPLEGVTSVAPFGFRLWDPVESRTIADQVNVSWSWAGAAPRAARPSPSGVYALAGSPAFGEFSRGRGDAEFWRQPPAIAGEGEVRVTDEAGRFMPFLFTVSPPPIRLTAEFRQLCRLVGGAPGDDGMPHIPLISTPARPRPSGMAMVTAQIKTVDGSPAPYAVLRLKSRSQRAFFGAADSRGSVVVFFPYPKPEDISTTGRIRGPLPLSEQSWDLDVKVYYERVPALPMPDLCAVMDQVNASEERVLAAVGSNQLLTTAQLTHNRVLVLHTTGASELLIDPD